MAAPVDTTAAPKPAKPPPGAKGNVANGYAQIESLLKGGKFSPAQLQSLMALIAGGGTSPLTGIMGQAQGEIDPIISAITGSAEAQAQAADKAISGYTNSYAKELAGMNYGAPYASAEAQQAAVDAAMRGDLTGQGNQLSQDLAGRLSALQGTSGAAAVNQEAQALAGQGRGAGNVQAASGSADLSNLIADAAAANEYGAKMPGVAKMAGLQGTEQAQGQAQQEIAQAITQAEGELPTIIQQIKANRLEAKQLKATKAYQNAEIAAKDATLRLTSQKDAATIAQGNQRLSIEEQNAQTSRARLQLEAQKAVESNKAQWARIGIEDKRLQLEVAKQNIASKSGGLTPSETSRYKAVASSWAMRMLGPTTDTTTGKAEPKLTFKDAMTNALKEGVPLSIAFPTFIKLARANGLPASEVAALKKEYAPLDASLNKAARLAAQYSKGFGSSALGATFGTTKLGNPRNAMTPAGAKRAGFNMAAKMGWGNAAQLKALDELWMRESGWYFKAKNPKSGALGIAQELGHKVPKDYATNPLVQIRWGLQYIKARYGSPLAAWQHEMSYGWY